MYRSNMPVERSQRRIRTASFRSKRPKKRRVAVEKRGSWVGQNVAVNGFLRRIALRPEQNNSSTFAYVPGEQEHNFATASATATDTFRSRETCTGYTGEGEDLPTAVRWDKIGRETA